MSVKNFFGFFANIWAHSVCAIAHIKFGSFRKALRSFWAHFLPRRTRQKTGLSAPIPRLCRCKACGISASIPCAPKGCGISASIYKFCEPCGRQAVRIGPQNPCAENYGEAEPLQTLSSVSPRLRGSAYEKLFVRQSSSLAKMHLQWFAAEDEGRTEEPTEHKIRKAREEGKVAKSPEVASAIVLLVALVVLAFFGPYYVRTLRGMMIFFLSRSGEEGILEMGLFGAFLLYFAKLTLPLFAACFVAAIAGNIIQFGFLFSVKPITPDLQKIVPNIGRFIQRAILSTEALFNFAKSLFKVGVIGLIVYINIRGEFGLIMNMARTPFLQSAGGIVDIAFRILLESTLFMLVLSFFDFLFQKHLHLESLKMSKQEVIRERKDYEGDPLVRQRLRQRMRELMTVNRSVPQATVVITNPTHYAVAVKYAQEMGNTPFVVAKGEDEMARQIRRIARDSGVPIVEDKPLARALYAIVDVGALIPEDYLSPVALVLAKVYEWDAKNAQLVRRKAG